MNGESDILKIIVDLFAWLFVALPTFGLIVTIILLIVGRQAGSNIALVERTWTSIILFTASFLVALTAGNRLFDWNLPSAVVILMLLITLSLINVPAMVWLWLFTRKKF